MVSKKYSSLFLKPVASVILLFFFIVWSYFAFRPLIETAPRGIFVDYKLGVEPITVVDLRRFASLGTFFAGLFHGDFGLSYYTCYPVLADVGSHLPVTLSLIGMSTALSFGTSIIIILIASIGKTPLKEPESKPTSSAKTSLFELSFPVGFLLLLLLPSLPQASIQQSSYLPLLLVTLAMIFLARSLLMLHRGSRILSENWPRKLLFAASTINFSFIISIVVFVEAIFNLPGIGFFFVKGISIFDYNGMIGAVIALLTLAIILSCFTAAIDLAMHMSGLQETLEKGTCKHTSKEEENRPVLMQSSFPRIQNARDDSSV